MRVVNLYPGSFASNCYLLLSGTHAAVVDPSPDAQTVLDAAAKEGAVIERIFLTHGHFDHMFGMDDLRARSGAPVFLPAGDADFPADDRKNGFFYFFHTSRVFSPPDATYSDGDIFPLGDETIRVLHTPGHTAGSSCFLLPDGSLLTGDTVFAEGFGRTDLYSGDILILYTSLKKLSGLPPETVIYPGHGGTSTLGEALRPVFFN